MTVSIGKYLKVNKCVFEKCGKNTNRPDTDTDKTHAHNPKIIERNECAVRMKI